MAKYLDELGLTHFWAKLKSTFVAKEDGKGLSTNDYTTAEKNKLSGIAAGAEANVKSDWNATSGDAEILNKPTIPAAVTESTVSGWGFTKNTGTYSKPSTGIPESDLAQAVKDKLTAASNAIPSSQIGVPGGVVDLDENGLIDSSYLPSFVDDVIEAWARSGATPLSENWLTETQGTEVPIEPTSGKIYVLMADSGDYTANSQFRWGGTTYVKLNDGGVSAITNAEIDSITSN